MSYTHSSRSISRRAALVKSAGPAGDAAASIVPRAIPGLGVIYAPANAIGQIAGLLDDAPDSTPASSAKSWIPGVAGYRKGQRIVKTVSESNKAKRRGTLNAFSEHLGGFTSTALASLIGALLGTGISAVRPNGSVSDGAQAGAVAGLGLSGAANLLGALAAAGTSRRSKKEQIDNDTGDTAVMNYLVPGTAIYNYFKRYGASGNYDK